MKKEKTDCAVQATYFALRRKGSKNNSFTRKKN